jgi:hypothetical protein
MSDEDFCSSWFGEGIDVVSVLFFDFGDTVFALFDFVEHTPAKDLDDIALLEFGHGVFPSFVLMISTGNALYSFPVLVIGTAFKQVS